MFYLVIEIKSEPYKKPFFYKNRSDCYIRNGNTSIYATRNIILSLVTHHVIPYEGKIKHSQYILEIFKKLRYLHLSDKNIEIQLYGPRYPDDFHDWQWGFSTENERAEELEPIHSTIHLEWALSHLDTGYEDIYKEWREINDKLMELNNLWDVSRSKFVEFMKIKYKDNESILFDIDNIFSEKKSIIHPSKNMIQHYFWSISRNLTKTLISLPTTGMLLGEEPPELEYSDVDYFIKRITEADKFKKINETLDNPNYIVKEIKELAKYVLANFKGYTDKLDEITNLLAMMIHKFIPIVNNLRAGVLVKGYCEAGGY